MKNFLSIILTVLIIQLAIPIKKADASVIIAGLTMTIIGSKIEFNASNCQVGRPCGGHNAHKEYVGRVILSTGATLAAGGIIIGLVAGILKPGQGLGPTALIITLDEQSKDHSILEKGLNDIFPFINNDQVISELASLITATSYESISRSIEHNVPVKLTIDVSRVNKILESIELADEEKLQIENTLY